MKHSALLALVVCAALVAPRCAESKLYYGFTVGTANAPRAPLIRATREPHALLSGDAMVYVVDDAAVHFDGDLFQIVNDMRRQRHEILDAVELQDAIRNRGAG